MNKLYMGLDIGAVMTKGIIIDKNDNIIASACYYTKGSPVEATRKVIKELQSEIDEETSQVIAIGTTGGARKLIGTMLGAVTIKNEVMAQAIGTIRLYPNVKTILEIGGENSKIILINNGMVTDYAINTLCGAGIGIFLENLAKRMNINLDEISDNALASKCQLDITSRCMLFAENDLSNKLHMGYKREDVLAGVCHMIANSYINNVTKGKKILSPIVFNGGVSKNLAIKNELEQLLREEIIVSKNSHLMGALGVAIMARETRKEKVFDFNGDYEIVTKMIECQKCANNCQIVTIYKNSELIDHWGNRCKEINV